MPKTHRNSKEIKVWLLRRGISITAISRYTGTERTNASKTISGTRNNRPVLRWLRDNGCPAEYLALPNDIKKEKR